MEGKCRKCERVSKHKCLECFAQKFRDDHDNYKEEEMLMERCENCDGNQAVVKQKKRQQTLEGFFGKKTNW